MAEGFWDQLGFDEGGLPKHLPMGVTEAGEGPESDDVAHHFVCWCHEEVCLLNNALNMAWMAGRRERDTPSDQP